MLAARFWARGDVRVEEVPDPSAPRPGEVLVRVSACGICGTDVEEYLRGPILIPTKPHPLTGRQAPMILGHEIVGVIDEVGPNVQLQVGTRVALDASLFCGDCYWCKRHRYQLCDQFSSLGLMADGGLAEALVVPAQMCLPLSPDISIDDAVLAEPLGVVIRALRHGKAGVGSTIGIVGAGAVGLLAVQAARAAGASLVIVVEPQEDRRQLAIELGADKAVHPREAAAAVSDLPIHGVDVAIEAAGNAAAARTAIEITGKAARAVLLGVHADDVPIPVLELLHGEKTIIGSVGHIYDEDFKTAVALLESGAVSGARIVTDRIPLRDVVRLGFEELISPDVHRKIVVYPGS